MSALDALILRVGNEDEHSVLPVAVYTGTGEDPRPRLRVDVGQTSFFENREFRYFHEFTLAAGASVWLRLIHPTDIVVHQREVTLITGQVRYAITHEGTPSGVWTAKTIRRVNNMTSAPNYTLQASLAYGGTVTGAVEEDVMLVNAGTGGNSNTGSIGGGEVAMHAGTHYIELRNNGAQSCTGIYRVMFEEYQPRSARLY